MKKIVIITLLFISLGCVGAEKKQPDINLNKLEVFLSKLYTEIKCPSYPLIKNLDLEICLYNLSYNLDKQRIIFAYTAYPDNNRFLKGFDSMSKSKREENMFKLLQAMGRYTGILSVNKKLYVGKIQSTYMTHVYDSESIKKNRKIHNFVRDNAVVGIRVIDGDMRYVAFLDLNRDMHYKEGDMASILDFEAKPK